SCPVVVVLIYRRRRARDLAAPGEFALVAGLLALFGAFVVTFPLTVMRVAFFVQLQVPRVFWLLDFMTAAYLAWWLVDDVFAGRHAKQLAIVALFVVGSAARGVYLLSGHRDLAAINLPRSDWMEAMNWLKTQPSTWYVVADP